MFLIKLVVRYINRIKYDIVVFFCFLDVPNEGVYMVCGVLIAMVLVAVIIVILAVTIRYVENVMRTCYLSFRKVLWSGDVANIYKEQGFIEYIL